MGIYLGLGSNLGDRKANLRSAINEIKKQDISILQVSPVYENPALLHPDSPPEWEKSFLNMVIKIQTQKSPAKLLQILQSIERQLGRKTNIKRGAPRTIDIDILIFHEELVNQANLIIPHKELANRNFVLSPMKEMAPSLKVPEQVHSVLDLFRRLKVKLPTWMHIVNLTPDSFSDGGQVNEKNFLAILKKTFDSCIQLIDLGAESTRPGATPISSDKEWKRLQAFLEIFFSHYSSEPLRPKLSVDTRHANTARKCIEYGVDMINDVSGLSNEMLGVLENSKVEYVLTHSLTVPASTQKTLTENEDPIKEIKKWLIKKLQILMDHHISLDRIIFDPGIGFGKTSEQSLKILKGIREFSIFPIRLLVGHSRKSFMETFSSREPMERDMESMGASLALCSAGVDIIRVHQADWHARAFQGYTHVGGW